MTSTSAAPAADLLRERAAHFAAQTALFLRDQALSTASHDLRSPLNAMHSWAYVLERLLADADPNQQRALAGIRSGIDQQTRLIDEALDAPRAATRTLTLTPQPFALRALFDEVVALARIGLADARQVTIDATLTDGTQPCTADRERVAQALWTMLIAAVEASAAGGRVTLSCVREDRRLVARVTGDVHAAALADDALAHVLDPFARRDMLRERDVKGFAWTLALAYRVALAHGGTFAHDPFTDGGTATITLGLPGEATV